MNVELFRQEIPAGSNTYIPIHDLIHNWSGLNYFCSKKKCCKKYKEKGKKRCKKCPDRN
jgi:ferric iron reductase protein FhuF